MLLPINLKISTKALPQAMSKFNSFWAMQQRHAEVEAHGRRVSQVSAGIARELGMSQSDATAIKLAARLHDIGKLKLAPIWLKKRDA
ncbi:MAG: HD domain-containing protein [Deinococcales bacterium]